MNEHNTCFNCNEPFESEHFCEECCIHEWQETPIGDDQMEMICKSCGILFVRVLTERQI